MTVCMVNTFHYRRGGDSSYVLGLQDELASRGTNVASFAMRHADSLPSKFSEFFADEIDYPRLRAKGGVRGAFEVVRKAVYNRQARASLARLLDSEPCRLAHVHTVMHHLTASVVLELYARELPVIWTLHDLKSVCPTTHFLREGKACEACNGGRFYNALRYRCKRKNVGASAIVTAELYLHRLWKVYERADLILAPSRFLRDKVIEAGLKPRRIEVLPNFIRAKDIEVSAGEGDYVLYVGRITPEKGVGTLARACAAAGVPLRIVGDGDLLPHLVKEAAQKGWTNISWEGYRFGAELDALFQGARIVAVPSECRENCPMVVLEAMARGKPVLGSRLGGLIEILEDRGTGELVEAGSVENWQLAVVRWMHDSARCREAGHAARREAETMFAPDRHVSKLLEFYDQVSPGIAPAVQP
jgi:glycosyltransferase involved in cell wall biosynthesis